VAFLQTASFIVSDAFAASESFEATSNPSSATFAPSIDFGATQLLKDSSLSPLSANLEISNVADQSASSADSVLFVSGGHSPSNDRVSSDRLDLSITLEFSLILPPTAKLTMSAVFAVSVKPSSATFAPSFDSGETRLLEDSLLSPLSANHENSDLIDESVSRDDSTLVASESRVATNDAVSSDSLDASLPLPLSVFFPPTSLFISGGFAASRTFRASMNPGSAVGHRSKRSNDTSALGVSLADRQSHNIEASDWIDQSATYTDSALIVCVSLTATNHLLSSNSQDGSRVCPFSIGLQSTSSLIISDKFAGSRYMGESITIWSANLSASDDRGNTVGCAKSAQLMASLVLEHSSPFDGSETFATSRSGISRQFQGSREVIQSEKQQQTIYVKISDELARSSVRLKSNEQEVTVKLISKELIPSIAGGLSDGATPTNGQAFSKASKHKEKFSGSTNPGSSRGFVSDSFVSRAFTPTGVNESGNAAITDIFLATQVFPSAFGFHDSSQAAASSWVDASLEFWESDWVPSTAPWVMTPDTPEADSAAFMGKSVGAVSGSLIAVGIISVFLILFVRRPKQQHADDNEWQDYEIDMKMMEITNTCAPENDDDGWEVDSFEKECGAAFDLREGNAIPGDEVCIFTPDEFY
jgi:hypothetical protein